MYISAINSTNSLSKYSNNNKFLINKTNNHSQNKINFGANSNALPSIEEFIKSATRKRLINKHNPYNGFKLPDEMLRDIIDSVQRFYGKLDKPYYSVICPYVIQVYQDEITNQRGNKDGFTAINELQKDFKTKLDKYGDIGAEVYNVIEQDYILHLDRALNDLKTDPDYFKEDHLGSKPAYMLKDTQDKNYLEYIKSKYCPEAMYSGQASAICGFETLNHLLDKQVLTDVIMQDGFQALNIFSKTFTYMTTGEFFSKPARYKNAFIKVVDFLSKEENSKLLSDRTFCNGLYMVLGDLLTSKDFGFDCYDCSDAKIEAIKRAKTDPEYMKEWLTPEWATNTIVVRKPFSSEEKEMIQKALADRKLPQEYIKYAGIATFPDGTREAQIEKPTVLRTIETTYLFTFPPEERKSARAQAN